MSSFHCSVVCALTIDRIAFKSGTAGKALDVQAMLSSLQAAVVMCYVALGAIREGVHAICPFSS